MAVPLREPAHHGLYVKQCESCTGVIALIDTHHQRIRDASELVQTKHLNERLSRSVADMTKRIAQLSGQNGQQEEELQALRQTVEGGDWMVAEGRRLKVTG